VSSPVTPPTLKGAFVATSAGSPVPNVFVFQYNPESLHRTVTPLPLPEAGTGGSERNGEVGYPVETINLVLELDATDQPGSHSTNPASVPMGIYPQLAALQLLMYPSGAAGAKWQADPPRVVFLWGPRREVPVALTNLEIVEEAFDPGLNPIRARVSLAMTVLNEDKLFHAYVQGLQAMAEPAYTHRLPVALEG